MTYPSDFGGLKQVLDAQNRFLALYASAMAAPSDGGAIERAIEAGYSLSRLLYIYKQAIEAAWDAGRIQLDGTPTSLLEHEVGIAIRATHSRMANLIVLAGHYG